MSRTGQVKAATAAVLVGAVGVAAIAGWPGPWWAVLPLAALVAGSELAVVHVSFARQRWTFSLTEGVVAGGLLLHGGGWVALAVLAGVASSQAARRQPALKLAYNSAQVCASAAAGAAVTAVLGGAAPAVVVGMVAYWVCNQLLSALPLSIMTGLPVRRLVVDGAPLHALHAAAGVSIGMVAAWLGTHEPWGLLGLAAPLSLVLLSYDEQTARTAEARLFAELANGQERAAGGSIDTSAAVVAVAAARLFGGADVELVLLTADGPVLYAGCETGVERQRVTPGWLDDAWVLRTLGSGRTVTGVQDGRPYCSAVLGAADAPVGVVLVRRAVGAAQFGRRDALVAEVLAQQAGTWLSVAGLTRSRDDARAAAAAASAAARALGDLGASAAPSLVALRESAGRLSRLATDAAGPQALTAIVDELHEVERAVAALLGAIALAADPQLVQLGAELGAGLGGGRPGAVPAPRAAGDGVGGRAAASPAQEWVTTGVFDAAGWR